MSEYRSHAKNNRRRSRSESRTPSQFSVPKLKRSNSQHQMIPCTPLFTPQISRIPRASQISSAKKLGTVRRAPLGSDPVSPVQMKLAYTGLNEKDSLRRIRNYFQSIHPEITINKPPTIQQFVDVVRCLLVPLCGPTQAQISVKNYKIFLPKCMTSLNFPFTVSQSFLKCPNTPHNFQQVCAIWIFLLDLVEEISSDEGLTFDSIKLAQLKYTINKKYKDEETCAEELIADFYCIKNVDPEKVDTDYQQYREQMEEYKIAEREALNEYRLVAEDMEVYQKQISRNQGSIKELCSKEIQYKEEIRRLEEKLKSNDQKKHESMMQDVMLKIQAMDEKLQRIKVSRNEVDRVANELEKKQRQLGHLRERQREYEEKYNAIQVHNNAIMRALEEDTFRCNTQIQLNEFIPKDIKQQLILDEMNVDTNQAKEAMEKIVQLIDDVKSQKNVIEGNVRKTTSKLAEADEIINHSKSKIAAIDAETKQLEVEIETLNHSIQKKNEDYETLSAELAEQKNKTITLYQKLEERKRQLAESKRILDKKLERATQIANDQLNTFHETTYANLQHECNILSEVSTKLEKDCGS